MTHIHRMVCPISAGLGGSGFQTYHVTDFAPAQAALNTFWSAIHNTWPSTFSVTLPTTGPIIEDTTGRLEGVWSGGGPLTVAGLGAGKYSAASGYLIHWLTGSFLNGRQVRGKTFFVPIDPGTYDTNGTIDNTTRTTIEAAANALVAAAGLLVWHRPTEEAPSSGHAYPVTSAVVPDRVAVLRSRRG